MKQHFKKYKFVISHRQILVLIFFWLLSAISYQPVFAQDDSTGKAEEESSLISPSLQFSSVQKSDNTIDLKAMLGAKVSGQFVKLYKMKVSFFQTVNEEEKELGFVITDGSGKALLNIQDSILKADADGKFHIKASFAGNKSMDPAEEELEFSHARLIIITQKEDSLLNVHVKLTALENGGEKAIPETLVGIYVKRLFMPLKVGEITTDENGEGDFEFPANLPGNNKGQLTILARVDENELYGNILAQAAAEPWGFVVSDTIKEQPRALWSAHPPLWMLITFIVLMVVVWGHYIVIVFELFRLKKEQPGEETHATNL